jgi:predicted O-methyltransferase YrrM
MLLSLDDAPGHPTAELIALALRIADRAYSVDLKWLSARLPPGSIRYPDIWPGEHYKLLAAAVAVINPSLVIEIGTAEGLSALAMKSALAREARLETFDIVPWKRYPGCLFKESDFDGRLHQKLGDLADAHVFRQHGDLLAAADLIFVDAPKDGHFEPAFLANLETLSFRKAPLLILDDIRLWKMLATWRAIEHPKLDLTSFGHWSGTGIVQWRHSTCSTRTGP